MNSRTTALHLIKSSCKDQPDVIISRYFSLFIYFCYPATWLPCEIMREQYQCHWFCGSSILLSDDFEKNALFVYEAETAWRKFECGWVCSWPVYGQYETYDLWWEMAETRRVLITWYMTLNWKAERSSVSLWFVMAVSREAKECAYALRCCGQNLSPVRQNRNQIFYKCDSVRRDIAASLTVLLFQNTSRVSVCEATLSLCLHCGVGA